MKTIHLLYVAAALVLTGCAGSASSPSLFVLDTTHASSASPSKPAARAQLVVAPVQIARMLDESGIVYQTGAHRVVIANHNRWAAPLGGQLRDSLIATLDGALTDIQIVRAVEPGTTPAFVLQTRVDQFMGHYDGHARITGEWQLDDPEGQTLLRQRFTREVPLADDGYEALVESLSAGWRATALAIAPAVQHTALSPQANSERDTKPGFTQ